MIRIHQLSLSLDEPHPSFETLCALCAKRLKIPQNHIKHCVLQKKSIDARNKAQVCYSITVDVTLSPLAKKEATLLKSIKPNEASLINDTRPSKALQEIQAPWKRQSRPVVIGAGPAGLFCTLALALRGARPILLERGKGVMERSKDIDLLCGTGVLQEESNVLFGEGGAGAFSDGKLTCGLNSPYIQSILQVFVDCGAPKEILIASKPHIGTDVLRKVLLSLRQKLLDLGAEIFFEHRLSDLIIHEGKLVGIHFFHNGIEKTMDIDALYLAIGHSARDTYETLFDRGVPMAQKPFAVGVRIEHLQKSINQAQYGASASHPSLPPAEYKLHVKTPDGRGVYTFCMCPGGEVINASSEQGMINVNGMSLHARDGQNANAAVLVGVRPDDFGSDHPLAGLSFQRQIERKAFAMQGSYQAPCQRVGDFIKHQNTSGAGSVLPSYQPQVAYGQIDPCLPTFVSNNLRFSLPQLAKRLRGFDHPDALLTAPETRSSSPVRILRNENRESPITGLYPLGEGAGYAGGIISAALDGLLAGLEQQK